MPRLTDPGNELIYAAIDRWRSQCLVQDGSLFRDREAVWTKENIQSLRTRIDLADGGEKTFDEKLRRQLKGASEEEMILAAELLFVHLCAVSRLVGSARKEALICLPLRLMTPPLPLPDDVRKALPQGLINPGQAFNNYRPYILVYLLSLASRLKEQGQSDRAEVLGDPWKFRELVFSVQGRGIQSQRECLLHLVHPDTFEPIALESDKQRIVTRFKDLGGDDRANVDVKLARVREALGPTMAESNGSLFFAKRVRAMWDAEQWDTFVFWAKKLREFGRFDEWERDYKVTLGQRLGEARNALLSGDQGWRGLAATVLSSKDNNIISWRDEPDVLAWIRDASDAQQAAQALWDEAATVEQRLTDADVVLQPAMPKGVGARTTVLSVLHLSMGVTEYPPFKWDTFQKAYALLGWERPRNDWSPADVYSNCLAFLDRVRDECQDRGLGTRDRLDAQALMWAVLQWEEDALSALSESDRQRILKYRANAPVDPETNVAQEPSVQPNKGELVVLGAIGEAEDGVLPNHRRLLAERGTVAMWWSYRIHPQHVAALTGTPFDLYLYARGGKIPVRCHVVEMTTNPIPAGIPCPWPEFAVDGEETGTSAGPEKDNQYRTWFLVDAIEDIPPLRLADFRRADDGTAPRPQAMLNAFVYARSGAPAPVGAVDHPKGSAAADVWGPLAATAYLDVSVVEEIRDLLLDRLQIVLQGPPGTGKTFLAQLFAKALAGESGRVLTVQFHPSYSYEDFVEGLKPVLDGGVLQYNVEKGKLLDIAQYASDHPDERCVLILDEMNRANLPRVFGELFFLLEYRGEEVALAYSKQPFKLPKNLYVIGTMNTADRSIALVDFALRRRFGFVSLYPSNDHGQLRKYLTEHHPELEYLADMLCKVNEAIGEAGRDYHLGHSYFMPQEPSRLTAEWARRMWKHSIQPHLEEFWYEEPGKAKSFTFEMLRAQVLAGAMPPVVQPAPTVADPAVAEGED